MEEESQEGGANAVDVAEVLGKPRRWPTVGDLPLESKLATLREVLTLKRGAFVYFLVSGGEVVYIGKAKSLTGRLVSHSAEKQFDSVYYLTVADGGDINGLERHWIRTLRPRLNSLLYPIREPRQPRKRNPRGFGHKPVLITVAPDWLDAFRVAAIDEGLSLSAWLCEAGKKRLPADVRKALSERRSRGRVPKEEQ